MKKSIIITCVICFIVIVQCKPSKPIAYNVPPGTSKENEQEMLNICNRGAMLFKKNCASCHGIFSNGKDTIPNFTSKQMTSYKERYKLQTEQSHSTMNNVLTVQQLDEIFLFLNFRKVGK